MGKLQISSDLLCETCGYDIGNLPSTARCPECGREAASSLPDRRTGSPWQVKPSIRTWLLTNLQVLRQPREVFDRLRVDARGLRLLLLSNLALAGALIAAPWVGSVIGDPARHARNAHWLVGHLITARSAVLGTLAAGSALFLLTLIEAVGLTILARRRGWRVNDLVAWQVCAHASVGWIVASALTLLALVIWLNLTYFGLAGWLERPGGSAPHLHAFVPAAGFVPGMLVFEVLVFIGVRRCRFANAPRP